MAGHSFFQIGKPLHVHDPVEKKRQRMSVFIVIETAESEKRPRSVGIVFFGKYFLHYLSAPERHSHFS